MELIKLYKIYPLSLARYVEGYSKRYSCITIWNNKKGLTQTSRPFFTYTPENRVSKGTNPFIK